MGTILTVHVDHAGEHDLYAAGRFALQRHAAARERAPKRSAAVYLRLALTCARHLAKLAPKHADFWALAHTLVAEIILLARQHEAALFEQGGNQGAAYITVWIAAEAFQIQLADQMAKGQPTSAAAPPDPRRGADPTPAEVAQEAEPVSVAPMHAPHLAAYRAPQVVNHVRVAPKGKPNAANKKHTSRPHSKPRR